VSHPHLRKHFFSNSEVSQTHFRLVEGNGSVRSSELEQSASKGAHPSTEVLITQRKLFLFLFLFVPWTESGNGAIHLPIFPTPSSCGAATNSAFQIYSNLVGRCFVPTKLPTRRPFLARDLRSNCPLCLASDQGTHAIPFHPDPFWTSF
jgi:hypothetical protein